MAPTRSNSTKALSASGLTPETQELLASAMAQRGLSLRAQREATEALRAGHSGWVDALATRGASTSQRARPASKASLVKLPTFPAKPNQAPAVPASFSGKRMLIPTPEREMWTGCAPSPDREALKDTLAQVMEHGSAAALRKHQQELAALQAAAAAEQARQRRPVDVKEQLIDQLVHEVEERTDFLEAMTAAGRGAQYEAQVKAEIQQRLAALKAHGVDVPGPAGGAGARGARRAAARAPWQRKDEEI